MNKHSITKCETFSNYGLVLSTNYCLILSIVWDSPSIKRLPTIDEMSDQVDTTGL